jgi:segregation and condensation protein B
MDEITETELIEKIPEDKRPYLPVLEALIFSSEAPLNVSKIREIIPDLTPKEIENAVNYLNMQLRQGRHSFHIKQIAGGYQMFTLPEYAIYLEKLYQSNQKSRLTYKALETLAIIAYKQPLTKADIEEIRGVNVDGVVKTLLSRNLITIAGRAQAPGSPFIYKTTPRFLDYFGLNSLTDLPKLKEIDELIDVEGEEKEQYDVLFREIAPGQLGMKVNGNNQNEDGAEGEGKAKDAT